MKKVCRICWPSPHAGVDAVFNKYEVILQTLHEIQFDCPTGFLATTLLKKIKGSGFLGTLYLLKYKLPSSWELKEKSQVGSLNFSRTMPSISRCKTQLESLNIMFTDIQQNILINPVRKYANSICQDIYARFASNSCEIFTVLSIFDVDLLPTQYSPTFSVYGIEEISCLGKQFFLNATNSSLLGQWNDFKFEIIKMKKKTATFRNQLQLNKIKFKKTSTEWTWEHIFKGVVSFPVVT